jgi:hypothetical protein
MLREKYKSCSISSLPVTDGAANVLKLRTRLNKNEWNPSPKRKKVTSRLYGQLRWRDQAHFAFSNSHSISTRRTCFRTAQTSKIQSKFSNFFLHWKINVHSLDLVKKIAFVFRWIILHFSEMFTDISMKCSRDFAKNLRMKMTRCVEMMIKIAKFQISG